MEEKKSLTAEEFRSTLRELSSESYREFHAGLLPGTEKIMGVRVPELRKLARQIAKGDWQSFLSLPDEGWYEEIMVKGMVIGYASMDRERRMQELDAFVPRIDNWAVCDCCASTCKFIQKDREAWYPWLLEKRNQGTEFSIRFAVVALMDYYTDETWLEQLLEIYGGIRHEAYYVKMGVAWAVSLCYVRFPERTEEWLKEQHLDVTTHNMAVQKIRESRRVSREKKEELKALKR